MDTAKVASSELPMTAGDLSQAQHAHLVEIEPRRWITFGGIRRWTRDGVEVVGLLHLGDTSSPFRGTEYVVPADRQVRVLKGASKGYPRARKADYR